MTTLSTDEVRRAWHAAHLAPLWESPNAHKPPPAPADSHQWRWAELRPLLELAFAQTSPAAVERRVLQLMSPQSQSLADEFTAGSVLAAIQCLLPGEAARPHRHPMNALRFMLEGEGAVTIVDGKECPMAFGDLILTPGWCWHQHRHDGDAPVLWLDVLDVPLHAYLGTAKFQPGPIAQMPQTMADAAFASPSIVPEEITGRRDHSPVFRYPYADAARAVAHAPLSSDGLRRVRYANPLTGGAAMAMLDSAMVQIDAGPASRPTRSTANVVCAVVEGQGETRVGEKTLRWGPRDIFTLPQHQWVSHRSLEGQARLFMVSDRDLLRRLGLLEEETQTAAV